MSCGRVRGIGDRVLNTSTALSAKLLFAYSRRTLL